MTKTTTTTKEQADMLKTPYVVIPQQTIEQPKMSSTTQENLNKIEENKKIYETILEKPQTPLEDITKIIAEQAIQEIKENPINTTIPNTTSEDVYQELTIIMQNEDLKSKVEKAVLPIITSCKLTGDALAKKLEESEKAEIRQQALYLRILLFVDSFGITKTALKFGFGVAITYTIYNLIRYRQIPLGGFIEGLFSPTSSMPNTGLASNIINPANNITINMPSIDTIKQSIPLPTATSIGSFIDQSGPEGWLFIGGIIWVIKKIK